MIHRTSLVAMACVGMVVACTHTRSNEPASEPPEDRSATLTVSTVFELPALWEKSGRLPEEVAEAYAGATNALAVGSDLIARATVSNTSWSATQPATMRLFRVSLSPPVPPTDVALATQAYRGPAADLLRPLLADGRAAGNWGDLYENRDNRHSHLDTALFPGLSRVVYGSEAVTQRIDHGMACTLFSLPTLGNASLASTSGPAWRSLPRFAYIDELRAAQLALLYFSNQMHLYPEHRDHDPQPGDVYPANTPYIVISQGSSGSDQPFLRALFATLAAFQPETKRHLVQQHHLMPTLQMLLRSTQRGLEGPDAYFTGTAHPVVFNADRLDAEAMVRKAQAMMPAEIVPVPVLRMINESPARPGTDYFDTADERLFTTPCAIARVFRTLAYTHAMTIAASPTMPPPEGSTWRWAVLQGDPVKVRIVPNTTDNATVRIEVDWHAAVTSAVDAALCSARVDIGCFLTTPTGLVSAPSFVSVAFLRDELRVYSADSPHRLLSADYTVKPPYVDPLLTARRDWRDEYHYASDGHLVGWTRHRGATTERFTSDGCVVDSADADGNPLLVRAVSYRREAAAQEGAMPTLVQDNGEPR